MLFFKQIFSSFRRCTYLPYSSKETSTIWHPSHYTCSRWATKDLPVVILSFCLVLANLYCSATKQTWTTCVRLYLKVDWPGVDPKMMLYVRCPGYYSTSLHGKYIHLFNTKVDIRKNQHTDRHTTDTFNDYTPSTVWNMYTLSSHGQNKLKLEYLAVYGRTSLHRYLVNKYHF